MLFNDKVYEVLKWACLIFIPALEGFYAAVDTLFGWGLIQQVSIVLTSLQLFIGSLIGISTKEYNNAKVEKCE